MISTKRRSFLMGRVRRCAMIGICTAGAVLSLCTPVAATTLFRAGDFNGTYSFGVELPGGNYSRWYKDFSVPAGQSWDVGALGNVAIIGPRTASDLASANVYYEIRSGITPGDGGTLIASGTVKVDDASLVSLGNAPNGPVFEYTITLPSAVTLGPGLYWATLQPVATSSLNYFTGFTSGANAIGEPPIDDAVFFDGRFGVSIVNDFIADDNEAALRVIGVPEPASLALLTLGGALTMAARRHGR